MPSATSPPVPTPALLSILFYPISLEGRRGTTDEFATVPFHLDLLAHLGPPLYILILPFHSNLLSKSDYSI